MSETCDWREEFLKVQKERDALKINLSEALRAVNTQTNLYRSALVTLAQERDAFGKKETEMLGNIESLKSIIRGQTGEIERLKGELLKIEPQRESPHFPKEETHG